MLILDGIHVMYLNTKKNTFTPEFILKIHEALDIIERYKGQTALLTTSATKDVFSYGLDFEWLFKNGPEE